MRRLLMPTLALTLLWACSDDPVAAPDAGFADAEAFYDSGVRDAAPREDAGRADQGPLDVGFRDPDIYRAGVELVATLNTYLVLYGTATSTLPPVVFVPRGPAHSHEYLPDHFKFLLPGRTLVFYDQRGTGRTSYGDGTSSSTITAAQHARDLAALLDHLDATGLDTARVDLIGHGYGGGVALLFAAAQPTRVDRLLLIDPYPAYAIQNAYYQAEIESRLGPADRMRYYAIRNRPECYGADSECYIELWGIIGPHFMCPQNRDLFSELDFEYGSFRADRFIDMELRNSRYDWRPLMTALAVDTTVIDGPCSPSSQVGTSTTYSGNIPGADLVVLPSSGHFPMVEATAEMQAAVRSALARP